MGLQRERSEQRQKKVAYYEMPWNWRISCHDLSNEQEYLYKQEKNKVKKIMKNTLFTLFELK
jgi:hypothetical protein